MWRALSNDESIEKMAWKKSDSVYVVRAYDYGFCRWPWNRTNRPYHKWHMAQILFEFGLF